MARRVPQCRRRQLSLPCHRPAPLWGEGGIARGGGRHVLRKPAQCRPCRAWRRLGNGIRTGTAWHEKACRGHTPILLGRLRFAAWRSGAEREAISPAHWASQAGTWPSVTSTEAPSRSRAAGPTSRRRAAGPRSEHSVRSHSMSGVSRVGTGEITGATFPESSVTTMTGDPPPSVDVVAMGLRSFRLPPPHQGIRVVNQPLGTIAIDTYAGSSPRSLT